MIFLDKKKSAGDDNGGYKDNDWNYLYFVIYLNKVDYLLKSWFS